MPYPADFFRVGLHGQVLGGEKWSVGFSVRKDGTPLTFILDDTTMDAILGNISGALSTFWASYGTFAGSMFSLDTIRLTQVGTDGRSRKVSEKVLASVLTNSTAMKMPPQCALVISHLSGFAGRSRRGRCYLPIGGASINTSTGRLSSANLTTIITAWKTFLTDVNDAPGWDLVNADAVKATIASPLGAGQFSDIKTLKAGDVIDTQRRRRADLGEAYTTATL